MIRISYLAIALAGACMASCVSADEQDPWTLGPLTNVRDSLVGYVFVQVSCRHLAIRCQVRASEESILRNSSVAAHAFDGKWAQASLVDDGGSIHEMAQIGNWATSTGVETQLALEFTLKGAIADSGNCVVVHVGEESWSVAVPR
jgi:hypothetical protein